MPRSPFVKGAAIVVAIVVALLLLPWLLRVSLDAVALIAILLEFVVVLLFLAAATWVVANVWKSVMRR